MVRIEDGERARTAGDAVLAARVLELLPGLERHVCENDEGKAFVDELADTEVPHLFEHTIIELMTCAGSPRGLKGETRWDFQRDGHGTFRVSVEYDDDLVCLGAIKLAGKVMDHVLDEGPCPDLPREIAHLRELRIQECVS